MISQGGAFGSRGGLGFGGQQRSSTSVFGGGSNSFGSNKSTNNTNTTSNAFGQGGFGSSPNRSATTGFSPNRGVGLGAGTSTANAGFGGGAFGGSKTIGGSSSGGLFGNSGSSSSSSFSRPAFGANGANSGSAFGSSSGTTGAFGSMNNTNSNTNKFQLGGSTGFGQQSGMASQGGSGSFQPVPCPESVSAGNGRTTKVTSRLMAITAMSGNANKSFEELRYEDSMKGQNQGGGFGGFGSQQQQTSGFGGQSQSSAFGTQSQTSGGFGQSSATPFGQSQSGTTGAFGSMNNTNSNTNKFQLGGSTGFGQQSGMASQGGSGSFQPVPCPESVSAGNGRTTKVTSRLMAITAMSGNANKSFEELRYEDSMKGQNQGGGFGGFGSQQQQTSGFGGQSQSSAFGTQSQTSGGFGQTNTSSFGGFGQSSTTSFGSFGQNKSPGTGSGFGTSSGTSAGGFGQTSTSSFGGFGQTSGANSTGFGSQTQSSTTGGFGQMKSPGTGMGGFGQSSTTSFGSFGQNKSPGTGSGFGTSSGTSAGGFGQTSTSSFGGFGQTSGANSTGFGSQTQSSTTGGFGQMKSPGTGMGGFGQSSTTSFGSFGQNKSPGTGSGFGASSGTSAGGFGQTSNSTTPATSTGGGFGLGNQSQGGGNKPTVTFGPTTQASPSTGGFTSFGSSGGGFGAPGNATTSFGSSGGFGSTTNSSSTSSFGSSKPSFGAGTGFGTGAMGTQAAQGSSGSLSGGGFGGFGNTSQTHSTVSGAKNPQTDTLMFDLSGLPERPGPSTSDSKERSVPSYSKTQTSYRHIPRSAARIQPRGLFKDSLNDSSQNPPQTKLDPNSLHGNKIVNRLIGYHAESSPSESPRTEIEAGSDEHKQSPNTPAFLRLGVKHTDTNTPSSVLKCEATGLTPSPSTLSPVVNKKVKEDSTPKGASPKLDGSSKESTPSSKNLVLPKPIKFPLKLDSPVSTNTVSSSNPCAPTLSKKDYDCHPSIRELQMMSNEELSNIENFVVFRPGIGQIKWEGKTDVRNLDLDDLVMIEKNMISVYENTPDDEKPAVGQNLNKPAVVTLYQMTPKSVTEESIEKYEKKLRKSCIKCGNEFLHYDVELQEWMFRVKHF